MSIKNKTQEKNKLSEIDEHILRQFDIKKRLGKGAYGIVWKAIDKKTNQIVAVKKIFDAFRNETDAQRTFREIMFLRSFRNHPSVIQLHSIYKASNHLDIYLSFEFMESDLHNVIKRGSVLKDVHKRYVMYQLINAITYIHSGNVIHRDLKPSNVLIDSKCRCKIADFGLARSVSQRQIGEPNNNVDPSEPILTDYVATRWYRAPEILVASKRYTKGIDMWSLGCILGEMIRGKPLFPGSSTINQVELIICALPEVSQKDVAAVGAGFGSALLNQQINSEGNPKLDDLLAGSSEDAKSLAKSLLILDPAGRLTAKQAINHKYVEKFRRTFPEVELSSDILPPFRDDIQLTIQEYRSKLYEMINSSEKVSKITNKKNTSPNIEGTVTVTALPKQNSKRTTNQKYSESEKHAVHVNGFNGTETNNQPKRHSRKMEKRLSMTYNQNGTFPGCVSIAASSFKAAKDMTYLNPNLYTTSHNTNESKYKFMPKVRYCKITSLPESKAYNSSNTVITSDKIEECVSQQRNSYDPMTQKSNSSPPKRHSIDFGGFNSIQQAQNSQSSSAKSTHTSIICSNISGNRSGKTGSLYLENDTGYGSGKIIGKQRITACEDSGLVFDFKRNGAEGIQERTVSSSLKISEQTNSSNVENCNYYERRLQNLEEKIQKHKMDINALLSQEMRCRIAKLENTGVVDSKKRYTVLQSSDGKSAGLTRAARFNLPRSKSENVNTAFGNGKQQANVKFDYTHAEGDHRINKKQKDTGFSIITNSNEHFDGRKSQLVTQ